MSKSGKSIADDVLGNVEAVTKKWTTQRKAEERHASAEANRRARMTRASDYYNFKSAAEEVMEEAYMKASANDTLPANARQVMYAARPFIQEVTGKQLNDQYFCQYLLPNYMEEHNVDWDVAFDDRGHFHEPHTDCTIGLGTLAVREYLADVDEIAFTEPSLDPGKVVTHGPEGCYGAILFIEKEGFMPLFDAVNLAARFDIAIMSTKGLSVTAARSLIDEICGDHDITVFVLHDFDKSGFSIIGTLRRDTRRYSFTNKIEVIDLGLRLGDIEGLEREPAFDKGDKQQRKSNLLENGATEEEANFLIKERVELNAMASDQLVAFVERKLTEHGVKKIVPDKESQADAYRVFERGYRVKKLIEQEMAKIDSDDVVVPDDLDETVKEILAKEPGLRWTDAIRQILGRRT